MTDLSDSCFEAVKIRIEELVICSLEPVMGKMSIDSNIQKCESVCKPRGVCDGCITQGTQNMTEPVWQLGRKRSCKTLKDARHNVCFLARHNVCFLETAIQGCMMLGDVERP